MRKCIKYIPVECSLGDVKRGEFFRLLKDGPADTQNERELYLAVEDAKPFEHPDYPNSRHEVEALKLGMVERVVGVNQK